MDDDFELEVTDLRTGQVLKTARDFPASPEMPAPTLEREDRDFELEVTRTNLSAESPALGAHSPLATPPRRRLPRRRMIGVIATGALIVVVLVGLLSGIVSKEGMTFGLFPTPVPSATLVPGADTFYMANGVPWGKLLADGRPMNVVYSSQSPAFFTLPVGRHTIEYDATPFPRVRCTVSVPASSSDSCPLYTPPNGDPQYLSQIGITSANRGLDLGATLTRLAPDQLQALMNVAEQSLDTPIGTTTVPAGDRYQGANGEIRVAAHALNAQVFFVLNTNPNYQFNQNCVSLCDFSFGGGGPDTGGWAILANVIPMWRYTDSAAGTTVELPGTPQVSGGEGALGGALDIVTLSVSWGGAWQVTPLVNYGGGGDPGCFGVDGAVFQSQAVQTAYPTSNGYSSTTVVAPNPADGCLMAYVATDQQNNPVAKPLWFLYRFGLVLAANSFAHKIIPSMPVAIGSEARLAQQLATQLQPPFNG